jgi:tetratricopeptide (TPR) repeat protein
LFGMASYQAGNFQQAYNVLQSAARKRSDDPTLLYAYAWAAYSVGRVPEAEVTMQSAAVKSHDERISTDAKTFLSMIALERSGPDLKTAEPQVTQVLGADPNYVPALMVQVAIRSQEGDVAGAAALCNRILERFPDFAPAQKQLAMLYAADPANQKKAYELASSARETLADDIDLARTLAHLSYGRKEYRRVVQLVKETERQKPFDAATLFYLGMSQAQLNETAAARATLEKALGEGLTEPALSEARATLVNLERK